MKYRIAHLSDPHFGTNLPGVKASLLEALKRVKPDGIVISGDITQRARIGQYIQARRFVRQLKPVPVLAIPGNHDIPLYNIFQRLIDPYFGFLRIFKGVRKGYLQFGPLQVVAVNSTSKWRHIQGDFNNENLEKDLKSWEQAGTLVRIAAFHHPLDCAKSFDEKNLLKKRNESIQIFEKAKIDLTLSGHVHDPYVCLSEGRYPQIARKMILTVAGTCLSWRVRKNAPNSFNLIDVDLENPAEPQIKIQRYDINPEMSFQPIQEWNFRRRDENGWFAFP